MTEPVRQQPTSADVPQIAGNLWWDDVRRGMGLIFAGLAVYLVPFLFGRFFLHDVVNGLFYVVSAVLILLGLKMAISAPTESHARPFALGALGSCKLVLLALIILLVTGTLANAWIVLLALGLLANVLLILFVHSAATYLRARSLALLAMQSAVGAGLVSLGIIVAALLQPNIIADALTLLLIGVQLFLVGHLMDAIARTQQGLAPEATAKVALAGHDAHAAAPHEEGPDPLPAIPAPYFSDQQWETLETSDKSTSRAVIGLMTAIFVIGVLLYSIIAILTALSA